MLSETRHLILLDDNASWVRSFFEAMPLNVNIYAIRLVSLGQRTQSWFPLIRSVMGEKQPAPRLRQRTVLIPGWNHAWGVSTALARGKVKAFLRHLPPENTAIFYSDPHYVDVASTFHHVKQVYYAHDVFRFYGWGEERVRAWESRMLKHCNATFTVAEALSEDFLQLGGTNVHYSGMAISSSFIDQMSKPMDRPTGLADASGRSIIGCTGQINDSYDWDLLEQLAARVPEAQFVFIGPLIEPDETKRRLRIESILRSSPSFRWLGPKPHAMLPAYIQHFDVCLNPLRINEHNHRRCPLRLFDYMAANRPILSTPIREAVRHAPHVVTPHDLDQWCVELRAAIAGKIGGDLRARRNYIRGNTWENRAAEVLKHVFQSGPS